MLNVSIKSIFNSGGGNELVKKKGGKKGYLLPKCIKYKRSKSSKTFEIVK